MSHLTMSSGWLIDTYMHWHFKFNRLFLVYFIENEIWARARWLHDDSRCGDRRARKSEKRCTVERGMEEKYIKFGFGKI